MSCSEATHKRFLPLSMGVQDQGRPLCSLEFCGRDDEPGVSLRQFLSDDLERGRLVCDDLDDVFESKYLDDLMYLRCQLPGYAADHRPLLFLSTIPIKRHEVGRIVAVEMRKYMKELHEVLNGEAPLSSDANVSLNGIEWDKLYLREFYTVDGKEWEVILFMELPEAYAPTEA